jgi:DNA polymerase III subunit delta'
MNLNTIKGHERTKEELNRYASSGKVHHAFLFYGIPGIGKFSTALAFASLLNCENKDPGCTSCPSCLRIKSSNHPDILIIEPLKGKSSIAIDQIRELIIKMRYAPILGSYKVIIIDQAELLTLNSTNALLKTLEEPPPQTVLIIVTSNIRNIRPTIISRCNLVKFSPLTDSVLEEFLKESPQTPLIDSDLSIKIAQGSISRALAISDGSYREIRGILSEWLSGKGGIACDPLEISELILEKYEDSLDLVFDSLLLLYRDLAVLKNCPDKKSILNSDIADLLEQVARSRPIKSLTDGAELIYLTRARIFHNNANSKIALDDLFLRLQYGNN